MPDVNITADVVDAARAGDAGAIEDVYRALAPGVYGFVLNQTRNAAWADDVTSDTFLEAMRSMSRFEGTPEGLRAWIFRIARNTLVDHIRRESRRTHTGLDEVAEVPVADAGPESQAVASDERSRIARYVDDLPPDQREVVVLRLVAGLPIADVAELTGKTQGAVKALQHRALAGLHRRMGGGAEPG